MNLKSREIGLVTGRRYRSRRSRHHRSRHGRTDVDEPHPAHRAAAAEADRTIFGTLFSRHSAEIRRRVDVLLTIGRAPVTRPHLIGLDEPTEGIQPAIIKDIGRAIDYVRKTGDIAILLVEQYLDFTEQPGDRFHVMERGRVVVQGLEGEGDREALSRCMAIRGSASSAVRRIDRFL